MKNFAHCFNRFAAWCSFVLGTPGMFIANVFLIVVWLLCGPIFKFSTNWQLVVNSSTTVATYLAVFLIQNSQNRGNAVIQAKIDALIEASGAHNRFIALENCTDEEIQSACEWLQSRREP
jgi:low affinity Fe/Cu permease